MRARPAGRLEVARRAGRACAWGPSTIRAELARLEELGLLAPPAHLAPGRVPTDRGYREYVDDADARATCPRCAARRSKLDVMRHEVDEAMRATTEQLSQVTNLLAIVSAPPIGTTTISHVEVLLLQPQVAMVVVITSTGGVTKRVISYDEPVDAGLVKWAGELPERALGGMGLGARMLHGKLFAPDLSRPSAASSRRSRPRSPSSRRPPRTRCTSGAPRACCRRTGSRSCRRSTTSCRCSSGAWRCSRCCASALEEPSVYLRIGARERGARAALAERRGRQLRPAAAATSAPSACSAPCGWTTRNAIVAVRQAAAELSRFVGEMYDE